MEKIKVFHLTLKSSPDLGSHCYLHLNSEMGAELGRLLGKVLRVTHRTWQGGDLNLGLGCPPPQMEADRSLPWVAGPWDPLGSPSVWKPVHKS